MQFVFVSNYFNHHQKPFCDAMDRLTGGNFLFIATSVMRAEREAMGYQMARIPAYVRASYESGEAMGECRRAIDEADVVIAGGVPHKLLKNRIRQGKLLLRYQERPFKEEPSFFRRMALALAWHLQNPPGKPIYLLCAGGYTASDYSRLGLFRGRSYKWGYFPETKEYDIDGLLARKNKQEILWCGRFLDWKQPAMAVAVAERLRQEGCRFTLKMIGSGEQFDLIRDQIRRKQLEGCVHLLGNKTPEQVRQAMEEAGIFLFTSGRKEGWGAVLNESMNSGCALVACSRIGSVPFLLKDGKNGLVFEDGDLETACRRVRELLDNENRQVQLGRAAYAAIKDLWNAECAAERLLALSEELHHRKKRDAYSDGPCAKIKTLE